MQNDETTCSKNGVSLFCRVKIKNSVLTTPAKMA